MTCMSCPFRSYLLFHNHYLDGTGFHFSGISNWSFDDSESCIHLKSFFHVFFTGFRGFFVVRWFFNTLSQGFLCGSIRSYT